MTFTYLVLRVPVVDVSAAPEVQTFPVMTATFTGGAGPVRNGSNSRVTVPAPARRSRQPRLPSVPIGSPIQDTATVSAATPPPVAQPTGAVTFRAHGPDDQFCELPAAFTSAPRALAGGPPPTAGSGNFVPTFPGTYRWVADYGGDANYIPTASFCGDPDETSVVAESFATSATPSVTIGGSIQDVAVGAPGPGPVPTGTVSSARGRPTPRWTSRSRAWEACPPPGSRR